MSRRTSRLLALLVPLLLALSAVGAAPTYAGDSGATVLAKQKQKPKQQKKGKKRSIQRTKRLVVKWQGYQKRPRYQKAADIPGIGQVDLMCRPNNTMIRIRANDRSAETQMWLAKYETKGGTDRVAVKTVRVYTYATAADNGKGGTGPRAHEGLNQTTPIEDFAKGSAWGVISQRPGRNRPGGGAMTTPATSFRLTWYWERFAYPGSQYCKMTLRLKTDTDQQVGLNWHGDDEAATSQTSTATIPGFGQAELRCETGRDGDRSIALRPDDPDSFMDYEYVWGEGVRDLHTEKYSNLSYDPATGLLGPVELPGNGMMRIWWSVGGVKKTWVLSSYVVPNNKAQNPELNTCEIAVARLS